MKLNICILDNDQMIANQLITNINQWSSKYNSVIIIKSFISYEKLLISGKVDYDVIFIHIASDKAEGFRAAKDLRKRQYSGELVLLSKLEKYAFKGYEVRALNFILIPMKYHTIKNCLDLVWNSKIGTCYYYSYRDQIMRIPYSNILYFSSNNHNTQLYLSVDNENNVLEQSRTLKEITTYLPHEFIYCYRGIVVNMKRVIKIDKKELYLDSDIILPISNTYYEAVKTSFIDTYS